MSNEDNNMMFDDCDFPEQLDIDNVTPATLLLEKRNQMVEVQKSLSKEKEEYARQEAYFQRREQDLRKKDLDLQENLVQFNKFLKDKAEKRNQYLKKADKERQEKIQKDKEIIQKRKEIDGLSETRKDLEQQFSSLEKYENYLESVKNANEEFPEIEYILKRYQVLNDAEQDLTEKEQTSAQALEEIRKQILDFTEEQNTNYLDLNNQQQRLLKELEEAQNETASLETEFESLVQHETNRLKQLTSICTAIINIHERCGSMFLSSKIKMEDTISMSLKKEMEERLTIIGQNIADCHKIDQMVHNDNKDSRTVRTKQ